MFAEKMMNDENATGIFFSTGGWNVSNHMTFLELLMTKCF